MSFIEMASLRKNKFLILRRVSQLAILVLFFGGNYFGWKVLTGNYSSAKILDRIVLSDPYAVLQMLAGGYWAAADLLIGALIVLLFYAIIGGRFFCAWVCPVNLVSDFTAWSKRKLNIKNNKRIVLSRNVRYYLLALGLIISAVIGVAAFEMVSPVTILSRSIIFGVGGGWLFITALFLFDWAVARNGWCGYLCPLGAFYALNGKYGLLKVYHDKDNCTLCNECFSVCPEVQVLSRVGKKDGYIKSGECTLCARCIDVCEDNALNFAMNYIKNNHNKR